MRNLRFLLLGLILSSITLMISCDKQVSVSEPLYPAHDTKIIIETEPQGATIFLNGDNTGKVTPDSIPHLPPGDYLITLKKELFLDTTAVIILQENETELIYINYFIAPRNFGIIECISEPTNAEIFLDDSSTGLHTPATLEFIWPGIHEIKYSYPEHRSDSLSVILRASSMQYVELTLQDTSIIVDYNSHNSGFPTDITMCIAIDINHTKWIGTTEKGLIEYNDKNWITYDRNNSLIPSNYITYIAVDGSNTKWIGTINGLVTLDANNNWSLYNTNNSGLPNNYINSIAFDSKGNTWIAASSPSGAKALVKFKDGVFTTFTVSDIINDIAVDNEDKVWLGCDLGVKILDGENWRTDMTDTMRIQQKRISAMASDKQGRIYIGAALVGPIGREIPQGLYIYDNGVLQFKRTSDPNVTHIYAANNGNIWVCTYGLYSSEYTNPDYCIIYKIDQGDLITEYTQNNSDITGYFLMQSVAQPNGDLWIASRRKGIIKFKGANL
ncbi:MAG: hypothetical protein A2V66_06965 [Ignavibacteria bacterium RBG_13_36_8]|nr:MAG: hypothetical protein A2V66_06965 [Ignavibacteria bacterium RBG_13_36_8]